MGSDDATREAEQRHALDQLVATLGGPGELLGLLADYRQIIAALASAEDANTVMPMARCWWSRKQKFRMALDMPPGARAQFLK